MFDVSTAIRNETHAICVLDAAGEERMSDVRRHPVNALRHCANAGRWIGLVWFAETEVVLRFVVPKPN